jgi:ribosomal protein S27E
VVWMSWGGCTDLGPAQFRTTAMTIPYYVNEHTSDIRAIKPGWYGMESGGKLSSGPFQNEEKCLAGITHAKGKFRASPWLARATARSNFRASPWLRTIKCPECGNEHVRLCTRLDEYGRVWTDNSCETCGHTLASKRSGPYRLQRSTERIMKSLVTLLALILVAGFSAATPKSQVACDKAGMNWDATATAPSAKCSSAFA